MTAQKKIDQADPIRYYHKTDNGNVINQLILRDQSTEQPIQLQRTVQQNCLLFMCILSLVKTFVVIFC